MREWTSTKLRPYGASIFDSLGQLARQHPCINLGQGFPDFDGPDLVKEAAREAIAQGHNQYAPLAGVPAMGEAIAEIYADRTGLVFDPAREITVLNGATEAMYAAITALCEPGDEWIAFAPVYDTYGPTVAMNGGRLIAVPLEAPSFRFDPDRLRAAFSKKTKAVILNSPHNPTGRVFSLQEMEQIRDLCLEFDAFVITDEVYEYLVWQGHRHHIMATLEGMRDRTITISSTAKTFSLTGWKIGFAVAPPAATTAIRRLHQFITFAIATPLQMGIAKGLRNRHQLIEPLQMLLSQRRRYLCDGLDEMGFEVIEPEGTFFCLAGFKAFSAKRDTDFARELITGSAGVALIPISVFYPDPEEAPQHYLRFCFAKRQETLAAGMEALAAWRQKHG